MKDIHGKRIRTAAQIRANNKVWDFLNTLKPAYALRRRLGKPARPSREERRQHHSMQARVHLAKDIRRRRIHTIMANRTRHATGQYPQYRSSKNI